MKKHQKELETIRKRQQKVLEQLVYLIIYVSMVKGMNEWMNSLLLYFLEWYYSLRTSIYSIIRIGIFCMFYFMTKGYD